MTADIISLAEAREAAQARETLGSIRAELDAHMHSGPGESSDEYFAKAFEILTRLWAHVRDEPPDGGSRIGAT